MTLKNHAMAGLKPIVKPSKYPTNVKIPEEYVELIDEKVIAHPSGSNTRFVSRAHFVRTAVYNFLRENGINPSIHPDEYGIGPSIQDLNKERRGVTRKC